jgi:hypothetical protein
VHVQELESFTGSSLVQALDEPARRRLGRCDNNSPNADAIALVPSEVSEQIAFDISLNGRNKKFRCVRIRIVEPIHTEVMPAFYGGEAKKTLSALLEDMAV